MARAGHPFLTEDLDRQRSEQRRWLLGLHREVLPEVGELRDPPDDQHERALLEARLREVVDGLIAAIDPDIAGAITSWARLDEYAWLRRLTGDVEKPPFAVASQLLEAIDEEIDGNRHPQGGAFGLDDLRNGVRGAAAAAIAADRLADDGYVDPRLR